MTLAFPQHDHYDQWLREGQVDDPGLSGHFLTLLRLLLDVSLSFLGICLAALAAYGLMWLVLEGLAKMVTGAERALRVVGLLSPALRPVWRYIGRVLWAVALTSTLVGGLGWVGC